MHRSIEEVFDGERHFSLVGIERSARSDHFCRSFKATFLQIVTLIAASWAALGSVFYHGAGVALTTACACYPLQLFLHSKVLHKFF